MATTKTSRTPKAKPQEAEVVAEKTPAVEKPKKAATPKLKVYSVVDCYELNVRAAADKTANVLTTVKANEELTAGATSKPENGFIKVTTPDGTVGYCMETYLKFVKSK